MIAVRMCFLILKHSFDMADALRIIPECYVDTNLVSALLGGIGVNHQKSCNKVVGRMKDKYGDDFAVGIIDNDKRRPGYLKNTLKYLLDKMYYASSDELKALFK